MIAVYYTFAILLILMITFICLVFCSLIIAILIPVFEWLNDIIIEPISDKIRDKIYGYN
jgi:hypothetical protein